MIEKAIFGEISLKIDGFNNSILCERLYQECKVKSLYTESDSVYLTTYGNFEKRVLKICEEQSCIYEILERKGAIYTLRRYAKRLGFYIGVLAMAVMIFFLSNTVMKVEIVGTADDALKTELYGLLREEGVKAGRYIHSINFLRLSAVLHERCDGISWASVGSVGSVVYVNVYEKTAKEETIDWRIPCNIISDKDAVIVGTEVKVGQLEVLLGDAVCKGELLVSGILEHRSGVAKYVHSYADIIGRYEEIVEFQQNYVDNSRYSGKSIYRKSICFFDLELPLPGTILNKEQQYSIQRQETPVKLFGLTLPIAVVDYEYSELYEDVKVYSDAQALARLYEKLKNYEENLLSDVVIVEKEVSEEKTDEGIKLIVRYTLEGSIGRDSEIFIH